MTADKKLRGFCTCSHDMEYCFYCDEYQPLKRKYEDITEKLDDRNMKLDSLEPKYLIAKTEIERLQKVKSIAIQKAVKHSVEAARLRKALELIKEMVPEWKPDVSQYVSNVILDTINQALEPAKGEDTK